MVQLTAEIVLQLEHLQVSHVLSQHVPGSLNVLADRLSRMETHDEVPRALQQSQRVKVPIRNDDFYRSWPTG